MTTGPDDDTPPAGGDLDPEDGVATDGDARPGRRSWLVASLALVAYLALAVTAALTAPVAFLVVLALTQLSDLLVTGDDQARGILGSQFGLSLRSLVRELLTLAIVLAEPWAQTSTRAAAGLCLLALTSLRMLYPAVLNPVRRPRATQPVETRNIDRSGLRLPQPPPPFLVTRVTARSHALSLVGLLAAALGMVLTLAPLTFAGIGLAVATELVFLGQVARLRVAARRATPPEKIRAVVHQRVNDLRPEVVLYHTGGPDSVYQPNMWLSTIEALPRRCLIVVRERAVLRALARTTTPVLFVPNSVDFMSFGLPDVRVVLYTSNSAKNIHMLRQSGVHHVFIGHGDSDKAASANPFSKVYTEIWVAGEAGRERYRRANVGIHEEDLVEVGRPQLTGIETCAGPVGDREMTVLYAPTWEGWNRDPALAHTSVIRTGAKLAEQLVSLPGVRVLYKPHPLTGSVLPEAKTADRRIRKTLAAAGKQHEVVTGPEPTLYECFNRADMLVSDISSVVSDFVASQKPYVVVNLAGLDDAEFRRTYPSTSAAYLLDPAAQQVAAIVDEVRTTDPLAAERAELKRYLLGPDEPDALSRFIAAVESAYERAVSRFPVRPAPTTTLV